MLLATFSCFALPWAGSEAQSTRLPQSIPGGFDLPNGWRITPAGTPIAETEDMALKMTLARDGRAVIATHSGYNPHGLVVIDTRSNQPGWDWPGGLMERPSTCPAATRTAIKSSRR